jgi:hypothetical protein
MDLCHCLEKNTYVSMVMINLYNRLPDLGLLRQVISSLGRSLSATIEIFLLVMMI